MRHSNSIIGQPEAGDNDNDSSREDLQQELLRGDMECLPGAVGDAVQTAAREMQRGMVQGES